MRRDFSPDRPEMMDVPDIAPEALREQLRRLEQINRWFGGAAALRTAAERLGLLQGTKPLLLADLATGFADHPRRLIAWASEKGVPLAIVAVDRHGETLRLAREATPAGTPIFFVQADATRLPFKDGACDAALCTLALHHFSEDDAIAVLREAKRIGHAAAAIDLVRGRLAYAATWLLTQIWMTDPLTRHDGRLSIWRAFTGAELRHLAEKAGWRGILWRKLPWFRQAIFSSVEGK
jgi:SAM-dependent methyltransferase